MGALVHRTQEREVDGACGSRWRYVCWLRAKILNGKGGNQVSVRLVVVEMRTLEAREERHSIDEFIIQGAHEHL